MPATGLTYQTNTVTASPADATEIVIATLDGVTVRYAGQTIKIDAWCDIVPAAAATAIVLKIRRDSLTGTQVTPTSPGPKFAAAGSQDFQASISVVDSPTGEFANARYVLTATMTSAATASTVNAVRLCARVD